MPIAPDTKGWTWVLQRPCPECGVDVSRLDLERIADDIRTVAAAWVPVLERADVGERSDGAVFTAATFARYFLPDPLHHLHDVGAPLPLR